MLIWFNPINPIKLKDIELVTIRWWKEKIITIFIHEETRSLHLSFDHVSIHYVNRCLCCTSRLGPICLQTCVQTLLFHQISPHKGDIYFNWLWALPRLRKIRHAQQRLSLLMITIPQYDAVPQYDVEADNYNAKKRRVLSAMPGRGRGKTPSPAGLSSRANPQGSPNQRASPQGPPPINNPPGLVFKANPSAVRCGSTVWCGRWQLRCTKEAEYRQQCRRRNCLFPVFFWEREMGGQRERARARVREKEHVCVCVCVCVSATTLQCQDLRCMRIHVCTGKSCLQSLLGASYTRTLRRERHTPVP
jgi:hypothetical protein